MFVSIIITIIAFFCLAIIKPFIEEGNAEFLFSGNNTKYAISSNLGSVCSLALFSSIVALTFKIGPYALTLLVPALLINCIICLKIIPKKIPEFNTGECNSLVSVINQRYGRDESLPYAVLSILFISLTIALEIAIFRYCYTEVANNDSIHAATITYIVVLVCLMYVVKGGFRGVLITDHLQTLLIAILISVSIPVFSNATIPSLELQFPIAQKFTVTTLISSLPQFFVLIFCLSLWFPTMMDFGIRNHGTIDFKRGKHIIISFILLSLFLFGMVMFSLILQNSSNLPIDLDQPFYHFVYFISALKDNSAATLIDISSIGISDNYTYLALIAVGLFISLSSLTTIDTMLITAAQLSDATAKKQNPRVIILIVCTISSIISIFSTKSVFAGIGTVWASLFIHYCSIFFFLFITKKGEKHIGISITISTLAVFCTMAYAGYTNWQLFIAMDGTLCLIYLLAYPTCNLLFNISGRLIYGTKGLLKSWI